MSQHCCLPVSNRIATLLLVVLFFTLLSLPSGTTAQGYFGTVSGQLSDPSGAVVQGAKVVLADQQKGFKFNTVSDASGRYLFANVAPVLYTVSVEMRGFEKIERTNIKVNVSENATANIVLKIVTATE